MIYSANKPSVTIAICNYNREKFLRRAIQSSISQIANRRHVEIIVVDDASTDNSLKICHEFENEIKIISHSENLGIGSTSNTALNAASGEYFMRVDSDDYISSELIASYAPILDYNQDIDFVYGDLLQIKEIRSIPKRIVLDNVENLKQHGAGVLFRLNSLIKVGGYEQGLRNSEDYDLLTKLISNNCTGFHYPAPLYRYFKGDDNLSKQKKLRRKIETQIKRKYDV